MTISESASPKGVSLAAEQFTSTAGRFLSGSRMTQLSWRCVLHHGWRA